MSAEEISQPSTEELLVRWQQEPTAELSLRLAEAYRDESKTDRAEMVLMEEVSLRPNHLRALLALGTNRLVAGKLEEAVESFELVLEKDPMHLEANKALVKVYMSLGERSKARDRYDLCQLLSFDDPEVEELELLLDDAVGGAAEIKGETAETAVGDDQAALEGSPPEDASLTSLESVEEVVEEKAANQVLTEGKVSEPLPGEQTEPFYGLELASDNDGYWELLAAEGLFFRGAETSGSLLPAVAESEMAAASGVDQTATLANLYLQQGHLTEAETIYRRVLTTEPSNEEALGGLKSIQDQRVSPLKAGDLLSVEELEGAPAKERKKRLLESYRRRLRGKGDTT